MKKIILLLCAVMLGTSCSSYKPGPITLQELKEKKKLSFPKVVTVKGDPNFTIYSVSERSEEDIVKGKGEESKFFKFRNYEWASYGKLKEYNGCNFHLGYIFTHIKDFNEIPAFCYCHPNPYKISRIEDFMKNHARLEKFKKPPRGYFLFEDFAKLLSRNDLIELKKEIMRAKAYRYKIHLQIKPEFLESFAKDFAELLINDKRCRNVYDFKVANRITKKHLGVCRKTSKTNLIL